MITVDPPGKSGAAKPLSRAALSRFLNRARAAAGLDGEVDVLLTDDATIQQLNRSFRGKNKPTDVLSFPAMEMAQGGAPRHVGDLAISLDTAARQAAEQGHALGDEVRILMLHGLLHLAGFDHECDHGEMAAREAELREELGLQMNLIARAQGAKTVKRVKPVVKKALIVKKTKPVAKKAVRGKGVRS